MTTLKFLSSKLDKGQFVIVPTILVNVVSKRAAVISFALFSYMLEVAIIKSNSNETDNSSRLPY